MDPERIKCNAVRLSRVEANALRKGRLLVRAKSSDYWNSINTGVTINA